MLCAFLTASSITGNQGMISTALLKLAGVSFLLAAMTCSAQLAARPMTHNGYNRPYLIYRPAHLPAHPAAVFMLGGITSTAQSASEEFGWTQTADQYGFLVVFPEPMRTDLTQPALGKKNITFWEMKGSRTHILAPGSLPVDDDGYLMAVLKDVLQQDHADRTRVYFAGFSSGSGMVQLFASRHPRDVRGVVAVATPLLDPPAKLSKPVPVLYIHGDEDEQLTAFEANSPHFLATPHGNWVTWGYLDGCQKQSAEKTAWGVKLTWQGCRQGVPVTADFVAGVGHVWEGSLNSSRDQKHAPPVTLDFTAMAWEFFQDIQSHGSLGHSDAISPMLNGK
jgi:polyhydroxybutyrate depolymerase